MEVVDGLAQADRIGANHAPGFPMELNPEGRNWRVNVGANVQTVTVFPSNGRPCHLNGLIPALVPGMPIDLRVVGFDKLQFPVWVRDLPNLKALWFEGGRIADRNPVLRDEPLVPMSVIRLTLFCNVDRSVLDNVFHHDQCLTELALKMPCISEGLKVDQCPDLRVLTLIATKELIGEVLLNRVAKIDGLEALHFEGCLNLTADHITALNDLTTLREVCVVRSGFNGDACEALGNLHLQKLGLRLCFGLDLTQLEGMPSLRSLCIDRCPLDEAGYREFFASHLITQLDEFELRLE